MMNRKIAPEVKSIENIEFVSPIKKLLGDVPFFLMNKGLDETARLELYFDGGKINGIDGIPSFACGLLLSGTKELNAIQIQEKINSLGGFYETGVGMENSVISLYCLKEFLPELIAVLSDAIYNADFPENEVKEYLADKKQQHLISMEKVSMLARREFQQHLLASDQRYASVVSDSTFDHIDRNDLIDFHSKFYKNGLQRVVLVGDFQENELVDFANSFSNFSSANTTNSSDKIVSDVGHFHIEKDGAMQSAIRVGKMLFNKNHEDYSDFLVLNTILGDYFGSRLMANIREDKGYTYGIGSMINEMQETGYFMIGTEVKKEVLSDAIDQIKFEINRLQEDLVSEDELLLVKNYMLGQLLKSADGPFAMMDLFMSVEIQGLELDFFNASINAINSITTERIQELARKYLNWDEMTIISAG